MMSGQYEYLNLVSNFVNHTSLVFIIPQPPAFNTRIVLGNRAMCLIGIVRRDCTISTYFGFLNMRNIHSVAASAYPLL